MAFIHWTVRIKPLCHFDFHVNIDGIPPVGTRIKYKPDDTILTYEVESVYLCVPNALEESDIDKPAPDCQIGYIYVREIEDENQTPQASRHTPSSSTT